MLEAADAALDAGDLDRAAALYDRLVREAPTSTEASQAVRALKILSVARSPSSSPSARAAPATGAAPISPLPGVPQLAEPPHAAGDTPNVQVIVRKEPYSTRTSERLRLTTWEKLDFGTTAFLYGLSVGFSYGLSQTPQSSDNLTAPAVLGALVYTAGAVGYLTAANPDRGDLPLALAITSYLPTTTLLISGIAFDHPDGKKVSFAVGTTGLLSIPLALVATRNLDLDPGDTQLVRDAGFWGLVLATTGMLGFGGQSSDSFGFVTYQQPTNRRVAIAGALGLYGGLGLGILAAANSEVSLERVRVATWGGYGGALLGLLLGASGNGDRDAWRGITIGGALGLCVTFLATSSLDGIPAESTTVARASRGGGRLVPAIVPLPLAAGGSSIPTLGVSGTL